MYNLENLQTFEFLIINFTTFRRYGYMNFMKTKKMF